MNPDIPQLDWQDWLRRYDQQQSTYLPDREERFTVMLDVLETLLPEQFVALDLACGPGSISQRLLARFPGLLGCSLPPFRNDMVFSPDDLQRRQDTSYNNDLSEWLVIRVKDMSYFSHRPHRLSACFLPTTPAYHPGVRHPNERLMWER